MLLEKSAFKVNICFYKKKKNCIYCRNKSNMINEVALWQLRQRDHCVRGYPMHTSCILSTSSEAHRMVHPSGPPTPQNHPFKGTRPLDQLITHPNELDSWATDDRGRWSDGADFFAHGIAPIRSSNPPSPILKWAMRVNVCASTCVREQVQTNSANICVLT